MAKKHLGETDGQQEVVAQAEAAQAVDRAAAVFEEKKTRDLNGLLGGNKEHLPIDKYAGQVMTERLKKMTEGYDEEESVAFFEAAQQFLPRVVTKFVGEGAIISPRDGKSEVDKKFLDRLLIEDTRAQLLMRAADIDFKGRAIPPRARGSDSWNPDKPAHLDDWMALYAAELRGIYDVKSEENEVELGVSFPSEYDKRKVLVATAYDNDPELFADTMIAFAMREGSGLKQAAGDSAAWTKTWQGMPGKGYDEYGATFVLSEEGLPYRPKHKKEDTSLIKKRLELLSKDGEEVETFETVKRKKGAAESRAERLAREKDELAREHAKAKEEKQKIADDLEKGKAYDALRTEAATEQQKELDDARAENAKLKDLLARVKSLAESSNGFGKRGKGLDDITALLKDLEG